MSKPLIYAELLSNIRQISVIAALDTPCDSATHVALSANGQEMILHHRGNTTTLDLPGEVAPNFRLQRPALGSKEQSWRLPAASPLSRQNVEAAVSNEAPWPAKDLTRDIEFSCRSCGALVLERETIKSWRDLPSENWAEMMDFWHCHKPDVPDTNQNGNVGHSHDDSNVNKGYGANSKFTARSGVGFVDLTTFLVAESDGTSGQVEKLLEEKTKYPRLVCRGCKTYLGHIDHQAEGYRLYKWRLRSSATSDQFSYYEPSLSFFITAQIQSIMLAQCCSRLVLLPMNWKPSLPSSPISTFLSLWILSPTIKYSTTAQETPRSASPGTLAMKIFWKSISATEANKLLDSATHEEVSLPAETIIEIEKSLRDSASFLPSSGRSFQGWDVGLVERFDG